MRNLAATVVSATFLFFSGAAICADFSAYEKTCAELGFKKRTPAYGECVLELDKRSTDQQKQSERQAGEQQRQAVEQQQRQRAAEVAARGDGTQEHQTCAKFGFVAGTPQYSDCRLRIDVAKREAAQRQLAYEAEQRRYEAEKERYEAQVVENEKEKERQRGLALMRFGAALMGGTSPYASENIANAGRASLGLPPAAPIRPPIQNFTITNGRTGGMTNCTAINNNINCF